MTRGFAYNTPNPLQPLAPNLKVNGGLHFAAVNGQPRGQTDAFWKNFAPRIGLAYELHPRSSCAPATESSSPEPPPGSRHRALPGFQRRHADGHERRWRLPPQDRLRNPFPNGLLYADRSFDGLLTLVGQGVSFTEVTRPITYAQQYSFGFQYRPVQNFLIEATYSGNRGIHLQNSNLNIDQLTHATDGASGRAPDRVPNPFLGSIQTGSLATATTTSPIAASLSTLYRCDPSRVHRWQRHLPCVFLKLERRFAKGFTFLGSYTNSKILE